MKAYYCARELADLQLPGVATTAPRVSNFIARVAASSPELVRQRAARGGGYEVSVSALPDAARAELARRHKTHAERQNDNVSLATLTHRQREIMTARLAVLGEIDRLAIVSGRGTTAAVREFLADQSAGALSPAIAQAARSANARSGGISRATLFEWIALRREGGAALAPRATRQKEAAPAWLDDFLQHYSQPQKPDLAAAYRDWTKRLPAGERPSYAAVRRAMAKLSHIERATGREGRLKLLARQAYIVRDFADLQPTTIYTADGTTFDAEVEHPIHGRPFKPEITVVVDVATRKAVGWSAGLAESAMVVADALARACARGIPALFYTDRGPGYRNEAMNEEVAGLLSRLGSTAMHSLPQRSQSRGVIENFQKRWIGVAKKFATYGRADMDRQAKQLAFRATRRDIALVGASPILPTWADFVTAIEEYLAGYNDRPHRALPWTRDTATGAKRHLSPSELWDRKVAAGAELIIPTEDERLDLFRPYEIRRVRRCMVTLGTNSYFATALDAFHEQDVMVGYDLRDARQVWIRRIDLREGVRKPGALICVAEFEGNKTRYVPVSVEQAALEKRAEGRRRRLADKLDRVEAELRPAALLTLRPMPTEQPVLPADASPLGGETADGSDVSQVSRDDVGPSAAGGRPFFRTDEEFALWIAAHPAEATATDRELVVELLTSDASKFLLRRQGVDLDRLRAVLAEEAA